MDQGNGGLAPHITEMAKTQSLELRRMVDEASRAEDARVQQAKNVLPKHRPALEVKFERERSIEVRGR